MYEHFKQNYSVIIMLETLKQKLAEFNALNQYEDYTFYPKATETEIQAFETQFNIRLPEDYRWFIKEVGNGYTDQYHGGVRYLSLENHFHHEDEFNPGIPFPFNEETSDEVIFENHLTKDADNGRITLMAHGCGVTSFLVVNGPAYGSMWLDTLCDGESVSPKMKDNKMLQFSDWMVNVLNDRISSMQRTKRLYYLKENEENKIDIELNLRSCIYLFDNSTNNDGIYWIDIESTREELYQNYKVNNDDELLNILGELYTGPNCKILLIEDLKTRGLKYSTKEK